jgi:meso-butanediol dehydrogenase / (S,S)-butanediol dehydrogenase / diacetyl reductase
VIEDAFPRTALVTGGTRGIGAGITRVLRRAGAIVLTASRSGADVAVDVSDPRSVDALAVAVRERLGSLDLLVCSAGTLSVHPVEDIEPAEWDRVMGVNARGPYLCARAFIGGMRERRRGCIVNVASIGGKRGDATLAHYAASKFAVIGFTQALAAELGPYGVRANCVCPGVVPSHMTSELAEAWGESVTSLGERFGLLGRPQTPEEIGEAVLFLARSPSVTAQAINVDGGAVVG